VRRRWALCVPAWNGHHRPSSAAKSKDAVSIGFHCGSIPRSRVRDRSGKSVRAPPPFGTKCCSIGPQVSLWAPVLEKVKESGSGSDWIVFFGGRNVIGLVWKRQVQLRLDLI
jgi:hypothetical protein